MTEPTDDVLCRFCGTPLRERVNSKGNIVWTRTGQHGPMVICEHSPNHWHDPHRDDPEHGHTFRIEVRSRGSYGVVGVEGHTDSGDFGPPFTVDVRAWNLPDALRTAAALFPAMWHLDDEPLTGGSDAESDSAPATNAPSSPRSNGGE